MAEGDRDQASRGEPADLTNRAGPSAPQPWMPPGASKTPNAEKYLLEADALRRRQLVSALLHGSRRTWREQRRIWPGVVAGIVVVAVIVAVFGVLRAVHSSSSDSSAELGGPTAGAPPIAVPGPAPAPAVVPVAGGQPRGFGRMGDLHDW